MSVRLEPNSHYIIIGNYGNDTLALIQWCIEYALRNIVVVSVDTGWAAQEWSTHVLRCTDWVAAQGYQTVRLTAHPSFRELIEQRGCFPTPKFQWCANVLKGMPILLWLDEFDPAGVQQILVGHRHASARSKQNLPEYIAESDSYGGRDVYYPLVALSTLERDQLLQRAGFSPLEHRSLECAPCINSDSFDLSRLTPTEVQRLNELEAIVHKKMFAHFTERDFIIDATKQKNNMDVLENMGCGDPYGCGI